jgi:hypothetical protein
VAQEPPMINTRTVSVALLTRRVAHPSPQIPNDFAGALRPSR